MHRTGSFSLVNRTFEQDSKKYPKLRGSVGSDLHGLEQDRAIKTDPGEARRRRTIKLHRNRGQSWGFTLQTYGIRNKRTREVEIMSYVDYVDVDGPAWMAGMKRGDIILSVNGESVEFCTHRELVRRIQKCTWELRLVVLFEDCCQKVELHERYLKLKRLLSQKVKELRELEAEEKKISQGIPLSRCDSLRQSSYSSTSSDWDIYSEITSPTLFDSVPVNRFAFREDHNQSFSDISTESSANSDSLSSVTSFIPRGEEDSLSLKSSSIAEDESKISRGKFRITRDSNYLSSVLTEDSFSSSEILEKEDSFIVQSPLVECEEAESPLFIEDDDRFTSFIQDENSRFLSDELEDNSSFLSDEFKNTANEEDEDLPISFQCGFKEEGNGFSHVEIEGRQRCLKCGFEQLDSDEKLDEEACRHTFPGSSDSEFKICEVLPEISQCLTTCHPTSNLPPKSNPSIDTSSRDEEYSFLTSTVELQAGDTLSQRISVLPNEKDSVESDATFIHRDSTTFIHRDSTTPRLAVLPYLAELVETAATFHHQDSTTSRQPEAEESVQFGPDSDFITGMNCNITASCPTGADGLCNTASEQGSISSGFVCTDVGFSLDSSHCGACKHVLVNCSCSNATCQDSNSNAECQETSNILTGSQDISHSNSKCQDISHNNARCQDSNSNAECQEISNILTGSQDISHSNSKSQDISHSNSKCQDISHNTKCQDITNTITERQDTSISNTKCQDISNKSKDTINSNTKFQDNSNVNIKYQDNPNSTIYADSSNQDNCSQFQDSDNTCFGSVDSSEKSCAFDGHTVRGHSSESCMPTLSGLLSPSAVAISRSQDHAVEQAVKSSVCSEHNSLISQTRGDHSLASRLLGSSGLSAHSAVSRPQDRATDQASVSSKKRLINGVLVNDRSYCTRL